MTTRSLLPVLMLIAGTVGIPALTSAQDAASPQTTYIIISEHTDDQCLDALDEVVEYNPQIFEDMWFGCMDGDHTGWMIVDAASTEAALAHVPPTRRADARAVKIVQFTPAQIEAFHQHANDP